MSTSHNLFEEKGELTRYRTEVLPLTSLADAVSNRGSSAYQPNALPLGQTGSCNKESTDPNKYQRRPDATDRCLGLGEVGE